MFVNIGIHHMLYLVLNFCNWPTFFIFLVLYLIICSNQPTSIKSNFVDTQFLRKLTWFKLEIPSNFLRCGRIFTTTWASRKGQYREQPLKCLLFWLRFCPLVRTSIFHDMSVIHMTTSRQSVFHLLVLCNLLMSEIISFCSFWVCK